MTRRRREFFLARREDFLAVARRGRKRTGAFWLLRYAPARKSGNARFGVSVAKKHLRKASRRNRLRRVLRESFRQSWARELFACDYFLASAAAFKKTGEDELRGECLRLLSEASAAAARKGKRK